MLSVYLPPVARRQINQRGEMLEAFALTYLASYANGVLPASVIDSYKRSFGCDSLVGIPRDGNTPAYVVAFYFAPKTPQVVIGIEGLWTAGQVVSLNRGFDGADAGGGTVVSAFLDYASTIRTHLEAFPTFVEALQANSLVTFAGYSLGGAVAELLAHELDAHVGGPGRGKGARFVVRKYGAPRIGDAFWYRHRGDGDITYINEMLWSDPIWLYPRYVPTSLPFSPFGGQLTIPQGINRDPDVRSWYFLGTVAGDYPDMNQIDAAFLLTQLLRDNTPNNYWFYHLQNSYRYTMTCVANHLQGLDYFRMIGLEHPDENTWGTMFQPESVWDQSWFQIADPAPRAFDPTWRCQEEIAALTPRQNVRVLPAPPRAVPVAQGVDPPRVERRTTLVTRGRRGR